MAQGEDGARWNPRSQRWERAARAAAPAASAPAAGQPPGTPPPTAPAPPTAPPPPTAPAAPTAPATPTAPAAPAAPAAPVRSAPGDVPPPWATSPYAYPPVPAPARRRRIWVVGTAVGVAVLAGAAVAGRLYLGGEDRGPGSAQAESTQVRDTAAGFSVRIPAGWQASPGETGYGTVYRPAGGDRSAGLQVFRATEDAQTACEVLRESTAELSKSPGYREISREPVAGEGCEQVYEYDDPASSEPAAHAVVRLLVADNDTRWVVMVYGPRTDAPLVRERLAAAVGSFRAD
ncbi:hypothetical protein [Streptomyces sp. NPDC048349]|uniref:hypothetical protein n=1 Tax=Streptomyces sp. NPDC048349 TaxID=3155486 RepID=UPI003422D48E